jgi:hypothetical protein
MNQRTQLEGIASHDVEGLMEAQQHYGDSWMKRGGVGAFMMLARKWDRLEQAVMARGYDVFDTIRKDLRAEGVVDDIRDLRRYLMLVEAKMIQEGLVVPEVMKGACCALFKATGQHHGVNCNGYVTPEDGDAGPGYVNQDR